MASRDFARPGRTRYVFLDTNALLDLCDKDRPGHDAMRQLANRSISHRDVELHASISSFKDLYYILSRLYKDEHEGADVLLTRDSAAFLGSSVAKKSPAELVGELSA